MLKSQFQRNIHVTWYKESNIRVLVLLNLSESSSFVDLLCFVCLVFAMPLCASVYMCLVVTCWERADLLALVCGVQL